MHWLQRVYYGVPNTSTCTLIYFFLKIKGVFSYLGMYVYSFFPKNTGVRLFGYVRLFLFLPQVPVNDFAMYGYFFWQKVQVYDLGKYVRLFFPNFSTLYYQKGM